MDEKLDDLLDSLGAEAREAFNTGGEWEWAPDSAAEAVCFAERDGDNWRRVYYPLGYEVSGGRVWSVVHECDSDGNWEYLTSVDVTDLSHDGELFQYSSTVADLTWDEYFQFVAETGTDPLGEFFLNRREDQTWYFWTEQGAVGCLFIGCSQDAAGPPEPDAPLAVREYLNLAAVDGETVLSDYRHPDEMIEEAPDHEWVAEGRRIRGRFTVTVAVPPTQNEIRQAAWNAIAARGERELRGQEDTEGLEG